MQNPYDQAMDKIRDEMAGKDAGPGIAALGEYLTARLQKEPGIAGMILAKGKTLLGAFLSIKEVARKRQKSGFAYVAPEEAFALTCQYFGIGEDTSTGAGPCPAPQGEAKAQALAQGSELDLDALMGD